MRLISLAQRAIAQSPSTFAAVAAEAETQYESLQQIVQHKRWSAARSAYERLLSDLGYAAAAVPVGGWEQLDARIRTGLAQEAEAEGARNEAETALAQGHPNVAVDILKRFAISDLPRHVALPLIRVRERAMAALLARGEGSQEALFTVCTQRLALEQAETQDAEA